MSDGLESLMTKTSSISMKRNDDGITFKIEIDTKINNEGEMLDAKIILHKAFLLGDMDIVILQNNE